MKNYLIKAYKAFVYITAPAVVAVDIVIIIMFIMSFFID